MVLPERGQLLRIFIGESDRHEGMPLHEWLVRKARQEGLAGATVLRGLEGFGAHSRLHTARLLRLSTDLPLVVEIVDSADKIAAFMPRVDTAVREGLATVENVEIRFYRSRDQGEGAVAEEKVDRHEPTGGEGAAGRTSSVPDEDTEDRGDRRDE